MKIVTWNVNSLKARAEFLALYLDSAAPDVLCLQELKLNDDKVPREMFEERGYHLAIHGQPQWNGVLIASKAPLEDVILGVPEVEEDQARLVAATTAGVRIVNLYCPQGQAADSPKFAYKLRFYKALREWLGGSGELDGSFVLLGDMNIAPTADDVYSVEAFEGVPTYHPLEHEEWGKLVGLGLHDAVRPHVEPGEYSFWDYRAGAFYKDNGLRIDHILVTSPVLERVETAWIDRAERRKKQGLTASDHAPVGIELGS